MPNHTQLTLETRREFHALFCAWLSQASDEEIDKLDELHDRLATQEARSMITFVRGCLASSEVRSQLPESLRERLQEANWPQGANVVSTV